MIEPQGFDIPGVEAVFRSRVGRLYFVVEEHHLVSTSAILEAVDAASERTGKEIDATIRAHQGRGLRSCVPRDCVRIG